MSAVDLSALRKKTIDEDALRGLVKPHQFEHEKKQQALHNDKVSLVKCFYCNGSGRVGIRTLVEHKQSTTSKIIDALNAPPMLINRLKSFQERGPIFEQPKPSGLAAENPLAPQSQPADPGSREAKGGSPPSENASPIMVQPKIERKPSRQRSQSYHEEEGTCWVCRGTGKTSRWIRSFAAPKPGPESEEEKYPCQVCYGDSEYGISTECKHFYCRECLRRSLEAMMDTAQFPAYCPMCRAENCVQGGEPSCGRIEEPALHFLQQRGVISQEFMVRFLKQQKGDQKLYFRCPARCGHLLESQNAQFVKTRNGSISTKPGKCPCGALVCVRCHQIVQSKEDAEAKMSRKVHKCPPRKEGAAMDASTLKMLNSLGKKCPRCEMFVQKNGGCNIMMCGTNAHGKLADALRNGGCGYQFYWDSGKPANSFYIDLDGKRVTGTTPNVAWEGNVDEKHIYTKPNLDARLIFRWDPTGDCCSNMPEQVNYHELPGELKERGVSLQSWQTMLNTVASRGCLVNCMPCTLASYYFAIPLFIAAAFTSIPIHLCVPLNMINMNHYVIRLGLCCFNWRESGKGVRAAVQYYVDPNECDSIANKGTCLVISHTQEESEQLSREPVRIFGTPHHEEIGSAVYWPINWCRMY